MYLNLYFIYMLHFCSNGSTESVSYCKIHPPIHTQIRAVWVHFFTQGYLNMSDLQISR